MAGPLESVKAIEDMLKELDASPANVSTIKSFHLKIADAASVAKLIASIFPAEGAAPAT